MINISDCQFKIRYLANLLLVVFVVFVTGACSTVTVQQPVGEPVDDRDTLDLVGHWKAEAGDRVFTGRIRRPEPDRIVIAWIDMDNRRQFTLEKRRARITVDEGAYYLNLRQNGQNGDQSKEDARYTFSRVLQPDQNTLMVVPRNIRHFQNAVEEDRLAGEIEKKGNNVRIVRLTGPPAEIDDDLKPEEIGKQFNLQNTLVLHRIGPAASDSGGDE